MKKLLLAVTMLSAGIGGIYAESVDINGTEYEINTLIERDLGPGVHYKRIRLPEFPLNVNILQMDMDNPYNSIETTIGQETMFKTESLVSAAKRQSAPGHEAIAGANGNFWCVSSQYPWCDYLIGACFNANLRNGMIATETNMANDQWVGGYKESGIIAVDTDKNLYINSWPFYGFVRSEKTGNQMIYQFNKVCRDNEVTLYNGWYPSDKTFLPVDTYKSDSGVNHFIQVDGVSTEIYLTLDEGQKWMAGTNLTFTIGKIRYNQPCGTRDSYDAVLVVRGATKDAFSSLEVGDKLTILYGWSSEMSGDGIRPQIVQAIGGNTLVMANGEITETNYHQGYNTQTYSRCAYGSSDNGRKLYVIVIDMSTDPKYGRSAGCTTEVMCQIIKHYGCTELVNCDAGGSAQMLVEGKVINKTTESSPRAVANGMLLYNIAPEDNTITRLEFDEYSLLAPIYSTYRPVIIGYNQYGALIDKDVKGITLSCDPSLGSCSGDEFTAAGQAATGLLTASLGDVSVSKEMKVVGADMAIRIKNILIDSFKEYTLEVTSTVDDVVYNYDPAKLTWTVDDPAIVSIDENGVLKGLKEGKTNISCSVGDFNDTAEVTVEISDAPSLFSNDWTDWTVSGTSGVTNVSIDENGSISYTYGSPRSPYVKAAKDVVFYSIPDKLWFTFSSDVALKDLTIDLRGATNTRTHNVKFTSPDESGLFEADKTYTIELPVSEIGDPKDLINYPVSLHSITFTINSASATKGTHTVKMSNIQADYENYAGVEDVKVDGISLVNVYPVPVQAGEVLNINATSIIRDVTLISLTGQEMLNERIDDTAAAITVPSVTPGVYIVKVATNSAIEMKKIIIK